MKYPVCSTVPVPGSKLCSHLSLEQTFSYYQQYPKDRPVLETFHMVLVTHMTYKYLITNFGDYAAIQRNIWSFNLHVVITVLFCLRDYSPNLLPQWTKRSGVWAVDTWLGSAALCDILVSAATVRSLWRSRTGISRTNNLITRLITWTINTGILTSLWAILDIVFVRVFFLVAHIIDLTLFATFQFTAFDKTLIDVFCTIMLAKFYANTLLATLNNRRNFEDNFNNAQGISLSSFARRQDNTKMLGVHVTTHTDVMINPQYRHSQHLEPALSSVDDKTSDGTDWKN
ncbi:hypothetical protein BU17DRAFT_64316 [Hysterangium stoloniferum]|nr:hypothetical protein BU17DRAFT_64316 [Hysterangium stoloniferum]